MAVTPEGRVGGLKLPLSLLPRQGFLYRALGFTLATGLEADKVEVLLLELLYKTDYSNDFDREVRVPRAPLRALGGRAVCVLVCVCVPVCLSVCGGAVDRVFPSPPALSLPTGPPCRA